MKKGLSRILCVLAIFCVMGMTVCASDTVDIKKNTIRQTNSDVELHEEPDLSSPVTAALQSGTPVIISEDAKDGWCLVMYRENTGYVQTSFLEVVVSQEALDSEFQSIKDASILSYQEAEAAKKHDTQTRIWGAVIIVLVVAIFGVGIASTLKKNKRV